MVEQGRECECERRKPLVIENTALQPGKPTKFTIRNPFPVMIQSCDLDNFATEFRSGQRR